MILISAGVERNGAIVNENGQLLTFATTESEDKTVNRRGATWSLPFSVTPAGANDYFFYLENTGTITYSISTLRAFAGALTKLSLRRVSGTPSYTSGTDITPVNKNLAFTIGMSAVVKQDTDTTGLTNDGELDFLQLPTANTPDTIISNGEIIVPPGGQFAMLSTVSTLITGTLLVSELASR